MHNGSGGSVWTSNAAVQLQITPGNINFLSDNATLGTTPPNAHGFPVSGVYGNALMKIAASCKALNMADYFTVHNTVSESSAD